MRNLFATCEVFAKVTRQFRVFHFQIANAADFICVRFRKRFRNSGDGSLRSKRKTKENNVKTQTVVHCGLWRAVSFMFVIVASQMTKLPRG